MSMTVNDNKWLLQDTATSKVYSKELATAGKYVDKNITINVTAQDAVVSGNVDVTDGSASMTESGFTKKASGTSSYYVTLNTVAGSVNGAATVSLPGWIQSSSDIASSGDASVPVSGNGTKLYIPEASITGSVDSLTAPKVAVSGAATGFTAAGSETAYYVTTTGTPTAGSVKGKATVGTTTGMVAANASSVSDATTINPTVTGSGTKVYIPVNTIAGSVTDLNNPSVAVSGAATGFTVASSETGYYVTVSGTPTAGSVKGKATAGSTTGIVASGATNTSTATTINPSVSGSGTKIYIPENSISAAVSNYSAPSVAVSGTASGFTPSGTATAYYVDVAGSATNGSVKATATAGATTGIVVANDTVTSGATTITPSITGAGKVYIPAGDYSASVASHSVSTTPVVTPSVAGTVTSIASSSKPSGTDGTDYWTLDPSGSVTTTGKASATGKATIGTAGYMPANSTGKTSSASTIDITPTVGAGTNLYIAKATNSKTNGTVTATAGTASTSVTGMVTTTTNTGYSVTATATGGNASVTASSVTVSAGYNPSAVTASTTADSKTGATDTKTTYIQKGILTAGVSGNITFTPSVSVNGMTTIAKPATGTEGTDYYSVTGSGTKSGTVSGSASVSTEGYVKSADNKTGGSATGTINADDVKYIAKATLANAATSGVTYSDASSSAPIIPSGGYLYINAGYTPATKISLARLVPDVATLVSSSTDDIISGTSAYDKNGALVTGSLAQYTTTSGLHADANSASGYDNYQINISKGYKKTATTINVPVYQGEFVTR